MVGVIRHFLNCFCRGKFSLTLVRRRVVLLKPGPDGSHDVAEGHRIPLEQISIQSVSLSSTQSRFVHRNRILPYSSSTSSNRRYPLLQFHSIIRRDITDSENNSIKQLQHCKREGG
ncbi:hypothetical protein CEXT_191411 [Caerostris extrusa]|uniref:Uncharacterized protein n=1 Tax=Caerostris extrusa TaxID=172846 RepID=A0AAV4Y8G5_CAEEX|nr:hypothetical protein CEXT_191411 [Caerostris extrusa]